MWVGWVVSASIEKGSGGGAGEREVAKSCGSGGWFFALNGTVDEIHIWSDEV